MYIAENSETYPICIYCIVIQLHIFYSYILIYKYYYTIKTCYHTSNL